VDLSDKALALARVNLAGIDHVHLFQSDLLACGELPEKFQIIVANLPYIPSGDLAGLMREVQFEPRLALDGGADGLDLVRRLIAESAGRTRFLALEIGDGQAETTKTLCEAAGYLLNRTLPDLAQRDRVLLAEYHGQTRR
jgi:release factor glutamine methyltransferase